MAKRPKLIAGNWKMNGTRAEAKAFLDALLGLKPESRPGRQLLICPPATIVGEMAEPLSALGVLVGAQDCHAEIKGAYTGDISAAMFKELGATHIIVGHSERRAVHGETDEVIRAKAERVLKEGLVPIVCVGETLAQREAGQAEAIVTSQVQGSVPDDIPVDRLVVAYEPVWAIGTGRAATLDDIAGMHHVIRKLLPGKCGHDEAGLILYGGSVKPDNAAGILGLELVDGALIGGASLAAGDFMAIANAV
jgi:triosephosphate isomerase